MLYIYIISSTVIIIILFQVWQTRRTR